MTPKQEAIDAMRVYAEHGAKALAPLLDRRKPPRSRSECERLLVECTVLAFARLDIAGGVLVDLLSGLHWKQVKAVHKAYWASPWTQQH